MSQNSAIAHRNILTRCLAALALVAVYIVSATALMGASTTPADARGRGRGGGRGRGWGRGYGYGIYVAPPVYAPRCYWSRRWQRTVCRY